MMKLMNLGWRLEINVQSLTEPYMLMEKKYLSTK